MQSESLKTATFTDVEPERPSVLVLHMATGSAACDTSEYFGEAVRSARQVPGLRKVVLDLSRTLDRGRSLLESLTTDTKDGGLEWSAVVLANQAEAWGPGAFVNCREVALCIDTHLYPKLTLPVNFHGIADRLQADARVVNYHVLLNRELIRRLTLPRLRKWLDRADFVTLVAPRQGPVDFDRSDLEPFFKRLAPLWEHADRFFHLHVDRAIKPAFFPWNLLSVTCPAADLALHLHADGRLFLCADSEPIAALSCASGLAAAVEERLKESGSVGHCEGLSI